MQTPFEWWRLVLMLLVIAFLLAAWLWLNKGKIHWKNFGKLPDRKIKILEQNWVSNQLAIYLVEVENQKYLLARTQNHVSWQPLPSSDQAKGETSS